MGFILEKTSGKGKQTVKVTPDSKNTAKVAVNKNLQIQVNGVTKAVVQLIQRARTAVIKVLCSCDNTSIKGQGEEIKISYWATEDTEVVSKGITLEVLGTTTASYSEISSGANPDGTLYKVFKISENSEDSTKLFQVQAIYTSGDMEVKSEVLSLTQNIAVSMVYCVASTALISPNGGNARITYYAKLGKDIITDGVELEILPATSDEPQPTFSRYEGTNPLTGNYIDFIIEANSINKAKYIKVRAKYQDKYSNEVRIRQVGKDDTILSDFDFLSFIYSCEADAGEDFDAMTIVEGTGIQINGKLLDDYPVGWDMGTGNFHPGTQNYLRWAGNIPDNPSLESFMINWKAICEKDFISEGIYTIYAKLYGNWYGPKGTGLVTLNLSTYKGTGLILNNDFIFVPDDSTTVLVSKQSKSIVCYAQGVNNSRPKKESLNAKDCYSLLATIEYDVASKSALLVINPNAANSGRDEGTSSTETKTRAISKKSRVEDGGEPW